MVEIKTIKYSDVVSLPVHQTSGSAGADLQLHSYRKIELPPHIPVKVDTGLAVEIPEGYCGLVLPRSGLASIGITVANAPGLIDCDYRGPLKVLLINQTDVPKSIGIGQRIAQLVIVPYVKCTYTAVDELSDSRRGTEGFGSTGK